MAKRQALKYSHRASWLFGKPVLRYQNNGMAGWCRENSEAQYQKGGGWTANLYGGVQSANDDWAAVFIPVNEMPLTEFTEAQWTYRLTSAETMGINMVIWVHDYEDFSKRAEMTQLANISTLAKADGWNRHILNKATDQFFFYGENTTGTNLTSAATSLYGLDDYQADNLFKNWSIYRISFEYGWDASGTFDDAWLAEVNLNGIQVPLKPSAGDHVGGETKTFYKATASDSTSRATLVTPAAAKRIRINSIFMATASATASTFELYFHTGTDITSAATKAIALVTLDTDAIPSIAIPFGDNGPIGAIGEVVSMRTGTNISASGTYTIVYREE